MKPRLVVLSGAGISAESGIATFRDSNGLWENHRVEDVATPEAWAKDPDLVNRFYNMRRQRIQEVTPNEAHLGLVKLEQDYEVIIITQNIDNLHERAGSQQVIHLHGEIFKMRCEYDEQDIQDIQGDITPEHRSKKGFRMRPHIVWFGESVPMMEAAIACVEEADIFVIIGTSLNVYPAAGLVHYVPQHADIYIIDKHLPPLSIGRPVHQIEMLATQGVRELYERLKMKA